MTDRADEITTAEVAVLRYIAERDKARVAVNEAVSAVEATKSRLDSARERYGTANRDLAAAEAALFALRHPTEAP